MPISSLSKVPSTSPSTGAVVVAGGIGVGGDVNVGGGVATGRLRTAGDSLVVSGPPGGASITIGGAADVVSLGVPACGVEGAAEFHLATRAGAKSLIASYALQAQPELLRPLSAPVTSIDIGTSESNSVTAGALRVGPGAAATIANDGSAAFAGDVTAVSDLSANVGVETIAGALSKVRALRGVTYERTNSPGRRHMGLVAQEVEQVVPEVVSSGTSGLKAVAYGNLTGLLVEAVKELGDAVDGLRGGNGGGG